MTDTTEFINLRTDFGFKRIFGSEERKHILIRFLNALLGDTITVTDVTYIPKEHLPDRVDGKRIIYDVRFKSHLKYSELSECKQFQLNFRRRQEMEGLDPGTGGGELNHFIIEMQNVYEPPFEDRLLYYSAAAISEQGCKGWDYWLYPVVTVAVVNFDMPHVSPRLVRRVMLADEEGEVFTEQLRMHIVSLPQVREWDECETELERILYIIKNMDRMDRNSKAYRCHEYEEFFDAADSTHMCAEDSVSYIKSLGHLENIENSLLWARMEAERQGMEEGMRKGMEKGMEKGQTDTLRSIVRRMVGLGKSTEDISLLTGLSLAEIQNVMA